MIPFNQPIHKNSIPAWLLVFLPLLMISCSTGESRDTESAPSPEYVQIQSLKTSTEPIPIYISGKLSSASEFDLSFRTGGFIDELLFDEGDEVKKGDLLATLDRTEIDAQVVRARNMYEKYRRDLNRIQNLYQDNAATLEQVDDLKTALENARAELDIALFNQERSVITAPTNGRLLAKYTEVNEQVGPGEPIFRLGENGSHSTVLKAGVSDRNITRLQHGDSAQVHFDALPGRSFTGHVTRIAAAANQRTGVFTIEITLNDPAQELRNGFVAKAIIYPSSQQPYITIPIDALVEAENEYVYIYVPDSELESAVRVRVKPVHIGNSYFAVAVEDLPDHSNVITRGAAYLRPGSPITLAVEGY
ncbi:efflux RND transporter periplasmic adaptor subunit [Rhodohalobacter sp. SW132]|uniref:efflux RND transporter periplasmic adaptor subunit n=1 Tax=Rhodohalobacter sp. SW132 TaxID=2293433 RepID=UPI000E2440A5|nr:efflux RND transporter periplasmic adaptor subunit [Rhodohalobacter sp. SW132]REL32915.1 efflux RND transporter periplasmic adaptor subunit [Rhodohalobacter sp. SW132]